MEIERRIDLPGNRAAAAARAMFPQSRHPVRRGGEVHFHALGRRVAATFWRTPWSAEVQCWEVRGPALLGRAVG